MKNKILIGAIAALVVAGGTVAVSASKSGTQPDDSIHQEDKISANISQQNFKAEDHSVISGQTKDPGHITSEQAADIAVKTVNGTVTEIEKELEHGRSQYKVELQTSSGEAEIRIDAESGKVVRIKLDDDDSKSDDGSTQTRHNGNDDNTAGDGEHRNRHSGDDDNKPGDGQHRNKHSGDDDENKYDDDDHGDDD